MPDRINDLLEDREGDLCVIREVLDDNQVLVEWDCRPGHVAGPFRADKFSNVSERVRELNAEQGEECSS